MIIQYINFVVFCSVSDQYSFDTDQDLAFQAEYRSGSGSRVLMTKNWSEFNNVVKKNVNVFSQEQQFTHPYASIKDIQATEEAFNQQKRTSSSSKHEIS
jgi:hypothetical protein